MLNETITNDVLIPRGDVRRMWWRRRTDGRRAAKGGGRRAYVVTPLASGRFMAIEYQNGDIVRSGGRSRFHAALALCERWNQDMRQVAHRMRVNGERSDNG